MALFELSLTQKYVEGPIKGEILWDACLENTKAVQSQAVRNGFVIHMKHKHYLLVFTLRLV